MDIKAYIESGAIESYILGLANTGEVAEIELLITQYPEIKQAVDDFAMQLEQYVMQNAEVQDKEVKNKLMLYLADDFGQKKNTPVIPFSPTQKNEATPVKLWQYIAAASILLFIISAGLNIYFYGNYQSANNKYQTLLAQQNNLQANNNIYETRMDSLLKEQNNLQAKNDLYKNKLSDLSEDMKIIANPSMVTIKMKGVPGRGSSLATVYWNSDNKDVYLLKNNLPQTPTDKQYQLWAIVNGKPVSVGMVGDCTGLCKMKNIEKAQAFAITLEKKGGSQTPTLTSMYVIGKV